MSWDTLQAALHTRIFRLELKMNFTKNIGMLLLAIFLILFGLAFLINLSFSGLNYIEGGLAIAAGVCILIGK